MMSRTEIRYPTFPLKEMDAAMLSFELGRVAEKLFGPDRSELVMSAAMVATHLHRGQTRRVRKNLPRVPYIEHPLRNSLRILRWGGHDPELIAVTLLHDTVEDCAEEISTRFVYGKGLGELDGPPIVHTRRALLWIESVFGPRVAEGVRWMTTPAGADYQEHIEALVASGNRDAIIGKAADLTDNAGSLVHQQSDVEDSFVQKRTVKYLPALRVVATKLEELAQAGDEAAGRAAESLRKVESTLLGLGTFTEEAQ